MAACRQVYPWLMAIVVTSTELTYKLLSLPDQTEEEATENKRSSHNLLEEFQNCSFCSADCLSIASAQSSK